VKQQITTTKTNETIICFEDRSDKYIGYTNFQWQRNEKDKLISAAPMIVASSDDHPDCLSTQDVLGMGKKSTFPHPRNKQLPWKGWYV
jgi:hypothetical protein